ncbi:Peptidyl-prolyl isomerase cwc27 [Agyrium rufum]|nr:Peptidyl-prolyl isomerase cwc27 [Agyrium rufum]
MSSLYNLEPQPTAKVLLQTTSGEILFELFAKQTPLTSRNFLQLCLDGYYNDTIFHRLVPGFIIQGGDPTGTGEGGESSYDGQAFTDEFHTRLKFNRRGLLGMANTGKDDNGSQFFITLGKTEELNGKNTMFGRVVGDTIYNLMKMGEAELVSKDSDRPLYPAKVTGAEILVNPFDDMVKRPLRVSAPIVELKSEKKKPKKKAGKTLLSFEDGENDGDADAPVIKKAKFNPKLVADHGSTESKKSDSKPKHASKPRSPSPAKPSPPPKAISPKPNARPQTQLPLPDEESFSRSASSSVEPEGVKRVSSLLEKTNAQIADLKASMKRNVTTARPEDARRVSALEQMIPEKSIRGRKRKQGASNDAQALSMLKAFQARLEKAPAKVKASEPPIETPDTNGDLGGRGPDRDSDAVDDEEAHLCDLHFIANCQSCKSWDTHLQDKDDPEDLKDASWMSHALNFERDRLGKDLNWKRKNEEELVVIDPREKAKDLKEEKRSQKAAKAVGGTRAWDK